MRSRIVVVALALVGLVTLAGPSPADTFRVKAAGSAGNFSWNPDFKHINKGDKIVWKNPTTATHTVKAYKGPWDKNTTISPGEQTSKRFKKRGTYKYRCTQPGHSSLDGGECSGMCGEIHVM